MTEALIIMGSMGLVIGIGLAAASKIFYVYVDPLILAVDDVLPGAIAADVVCRAAAPMLKPLWLERRLQIHAWLQVRRLLKP